MKRPYKNQGFTLVELSVSVTVIAFIVAGVVEGGQLVKDAQVRQIAANLKQLQASVDQFQVEYKELPGDMVDAQAQFTNSSFTINNGNGDGYIQNDGEDEQALLHLSLAQVVPGTYSGTGNAVPGVNVVGIGSGTVIGFGSGVLYGSPIVNWMSVARPTANSTVFYQNSALSSDDAYSLDTKIDDGIANTGRLLAFNGTDTVGGVNDVCNNGGASYLPSNSKLTCILRYIWQK